MAWMISEPEKSDWRLDADLFISSLQRRWPTAEIRELKNSENFSHEWTIPMPERALEGMFSRTMAAVVLDYDIHYAAPFALWFRKLAPETVTLYFYDDGYNMHIELGHATTEADIVKAAGY